MHVFDPSRLIPAHFPVGQVFGPDFWALQVLGVPNQRGKKNTHMQQSCTLA